MSLCIDSIDIFSAHADIFCELNGSVGHTIRVTTDEFIFLLDQGNQCLYHFVEKGADLVFTLAVHYKWSFQGISMMLSFIYNRVSLQ